MTAGNYVQAYLNDYFSEHKVGQAEVEALAFYQNTKLKSC